MSVTALETVLRMIDEAFDKKSWHGTNLRGSIRGLTAAQAAWRPAPERHNIWELVLHAAYWKYTVQRRLAGDKRGSFSLKGSNFFARPVAGEDDELLWRADTNLLVNTHRSMREKVAGLDPEHLLQNAPGGNTPVISLLTGIAAHDLYHAGQIQVIKRLIPAHLK